MDESNGNSLRQARRQQTKLFALLSVACTVWLSPLLFAQQGQPVQSNTFSSQGENPRSIERGSGRSIRTAGTSLPSDFAPWWKGEVSQPLFTPQEAVDLTLDNALVGTLMHSPQVRVISDLPLIRRAAITEAQARFDLRSFVEEKLVDTSDPVGSTLTTGGASRFFDLNWSLNAGIRRRTTSGAQFEAAQRIGYQDNNSVFFVPAEQGTARLALSVTQPLLNGAGRMYNTSLILLAEIDTEIARDLLSRDLQTLLFEVHKAYWDLYQHRAVLLQKRKLHAEAVRILEELEGRQAVDVVGSQIVRARAAVATREAAIIRYSAAVRNAESRLRTLINDPILVARLSNELVPLQQPQDQFLEVSLQDSLIHALVKRPEINQATRELRAASVKAEISRNELMPVLNLILSTYVTGLQGDAGIFQSFGDQFSAGRPSYSAGFSFDMPYGNRAANARLQQRRLEVRQLTNQLQATTARVRSEVEIAVREIETTHREMASKYQAMAAGQAEIDYLLERWRLLPGDQQVAGVVLDDVLSAQERLAEAEFDFVSALVAYNVALIHHRRVTGTLLEYEEISQLETRADQLPTLLHRKPPGSNAGAPLSPPTPVPNPPAAVEREARLLRLPPTH